ATSERPRRARRHESGFSLAGSALDHFDGSWPGAAASSRAGGGRERAPHEAVQPEEAVRARRGAGGHRWRGVQRRRDVSAPDIWVVVLAGGVGSRFWPLSTPRRPKQLLPLVTERPLLVDAVARLRPVAPAAQ